MEALFLPLCIVVGWIVSRALRAGPRNPRLSLSPGGAFPRAHAYRDARSHLGADGQQPAGSGRAPRILIVDHDKVIARTLKLIFAQQGYEAECVFSGEAAIELAARWTPDAVIMEIILVDLNGLNSAKHIVRACPQCRIILFSAQVNRDLVDEGRACGFDFYDKPVSPVILIDRMRKLLAGPLQRRA